VHYYLLYSRRLTLLCPIFELPLLGEKCRLLKWRASNSFEGCCRQITRIFIVSCLPLCILRGGSRGLLCMPLKQCHPNVKFCFDVLNMFCSDDGYDLLIKSPRFKCCALEARKGNQWLLNETTKSYAGRKPRPAPPTGSYTDSFPNYFCPYTPHTHTGSFPN